MKRSRTNLCRPSVSRVRLCCSRFHRYRPGSNPQQELFGKKAPRFSIAARHALLNAAATLPTTAHKTRERVWYSRQAHFSPVMLTFALASCSAARGRKCQTVATYRGVWPQNVSTRRRYEGLEL